MKEPSIVGPGLQEELNANAWNFLSNIRALIRIYHGPEDFDALDPEQRQRVLLEMAVQVLMNPKVWDINTDANNLAHAIGAAVGCMSADRGEVGSSSMISSMIDGYSNGRGEGIRARIGFKTEGRAN